MKLNLINFTHLCKTEQLSQIYKALWKSPAQWVLLLAGIWNGAPDPDVNVCGRLGSTLCCGYQVFCAWFAAASS